MNGKSTQSLIWRLSNNFVSNYRCETPLHTNLVSSGNVETIIILQGMIESSEQQHQMTDTHRYVDTCVWWYNDILRRGTQKTTEMITTESLNSC